MKKKQIVEVDRQLVENDNLTLKANVSNKEDLAEEIGMKIKAIMGALQEGWEKNMNHKLDELRQVLIKYDDRLNEMDRQLKTCLGKQSEKF